MRSDALAAVGYDGDRRILVVRFASGGTYAYRDVDPALDRELLAAQPHPWARVGERVKAHPFRRLD